MNLEKKKQIVEQLYKSFSEAEIALMVDYKGLDVKALTKLRKEMREAGFEFKVAKNTLFKKASEKTDSKDLADFFKGPNAIAFSNSDPISPAKILVDFAKNNEKLEIKVAAMNGKLLTADDVKKLASMPSRQELLAQFLSVLNAVPTSFVRVISGVQQNFLNVLNAVKDKKEE